MKVPGKLRTLLSRREEALNLLADLHYPKGRRRFILIHGILLWGMPMFIVMTALTWFRGPIGLEGVWLASWLIFSLGFWCIAGSLFGWFQWRKIERRALRRSQG
jgi:hypothetical protein